jgi:outer membrane protein insertion porin family
MAWLLALLFLSAPAFAQKKWPIESLTVEGLKNYSPSQVLAATGLKVGQLAGKDDFDAARDRLLASGVFETAGYRFAPAAGSSGYAASFQVVEVEPVLPVRFEGVNAPEAEITALLRRRDSFFGPKIPATEAILKRHAAAIEEYLTGKGHPEKITGKVVADSPEQFAIVFRPAAGPPKVAEVRFEGNTVVPSSALLTSFAGIAYGTVYSEPAFRQMLETGVRPVYEARGRIRVAFAKIRTEKAKDVEGLIVSVTVDEGASYDLGDVRLAGEWPVPAKELLKIGGFKTGDLAKFDDIDAGVERMKKRLRREGYMHAEIRVGRSVDDEKKSVALEIHPELGPQYIFGTLTLKGLDIHGEAAVKKLWAMKEGKPFNADYPNYFLTQIKEQGLFDELGDTSSSLKTDEQNHVVDVTLNFRPASTESGAGSRATSRRPVP